MLIFDLALRTKLHDQLRQMVDQLALNCPDVQLEKMLRHLELLMRWNTVYNLTALIEPQQMLLKHVIDSLLIAPYLKGKRFLDVGTGAGFPGIPLALALPQTEWTLLDSKGKKIRFLQQIKSELALTQLTLVEARIENFHDSFGFDGVVARAWTNLSEMITKTQHFLVSGGRLWAMKGRYPYQELSEIKYPFSVHSLPMIGGLHRHLIEIWVQYS